MPTDDLFATGGFTVDPNQTFLALTVPQGKVFVLTDVIIFPLVSTSNPEFVVRYRIEENNLVKFQYNTVGTATNWSQHFTSGIKFGPGSTVNVVNTDFSTGRTGFQLLGYLTPQVPAKVIRVEPPDGSILRENRKHPPASSFHRDLLR